MLKRISSILLSGFLVFLSACNTAKIPVSYRHFPNQVKKEITGSWTEIKLNADDITTPELILSGELIAIHADSIYILTNMSLTVIHINQIDNVVVYMFNYKGVTYATFTGLIYLPNVIAAISTGLPEFFAIGIPWVLTGSLIAITDGLNDSNLLIFPGKNQLPELKKFARFPKGLPPGLDRTKFHLVTKKQAQGI